MVRIRVESRDVTEIETPLLAVGVFDDRELDPIALRIDEALGGALQRLTASGEISGKRSSTTVFHTGTLVGAGSRLRAERVVVIGRGKSVDPSLESARWFAATAANKAQELRLNGLALVAP